jgi:dUTP pyrophosphatase
MSGITVKIVNESQNDLPKYESAGAAAMDVKSTEDVSIPPDQTIPVGTGLFVEIPEGYEIQVRPRSGLSLKTLLRVANSPGTIDSDYRGEIKVLLYNAGSVPISIKSGERVAQLVLCPVTRCVWDSQLSREMLSDTNRGVGGFGSTGK